MDWKRLRQRLGELWCDVFWHQWGPCPCRDTEACRDVCACEDVSVCRRCREEWNHTWGIDRDPPSGGKFRTLTYWRYRTLNTRIWLHGRLFGHTLRDDHWMTRNYINDRDVMARRCTGCPLWRNDWQHHCRGACCQEQPAEVA